LVPEKPFTLKREVNYGYRTFTKRICPDKTQSPLHRISALEKIRAAVVMAIDSIELPDRKPKNEVPGWKKISSYNAY
jgi:hypothetical protein